MVALWPPFAVLDDPTLSVVICCWTARRQDRLVRAIDSVLRQTRPPHEVIVVVDHNAGLLRDLTAVVDPAAVTLVASREQRGASGARNTGAAVASGDVLAFLDDDARAAPDWLEQMAWYYRYARCIGVGGMLEPAWESGRPAWYPREFEWVVGCTYRGLSETCTPIRNAIAANMSMRRDAFAALGGFRSDFGKVGGRAAVEDTELCIRARQRWPTAVWLHAPAARAEHDVPAARATVRYFVRRCLDEGHGKAVLSRLCGPGDGLAAEWRYAATVLPSGVALCIVDGVRGRPAALARAGAIVLGLAATVAGFARGLLRRDGRRAHCLTGRR